MQNPLTCSAMHRDPDACSDQAASTRNRHPFLQQEGVTRLFSFMVFVVAMVLFWLDAAPSISFHDSGLFAMAAESAGVPHPPGAPGWVILAHLFIRLLHFSEPARGTNVFAGFCGALTAGLLCQITQRWARSLLPSDTPRWIPLVGGLASFLVLIHSAAFLEQSTTTEQYTLMTALIAGILLLSTNITARPALSTSGTPSSLGPFFTLGLLWGLAIDNHLTQAVLGLLVVWTIWNGVSVPRKPTTLFRIAVATGIGMGAALLAFAWVIWRSRHNPLVDFGNIDTPQRLLWALCRKQWTFRPLSAAPRGFVAEWIASYNLLGQIGTAGLCMAAIGLAALMRRRLLLLTYLAAAVVPYSIGILMGHMKQDLIDITYIRQYGVTDYHLPLYLGLSLSAGIGLSVMGDAARRRWKFAPLATAAVLLFLATTAGMNVRRSSLHSWTAPSDFLQEVLAPLPRPAAIVVGSDNLSNMLAYRTYVHPKEPDLWVAYGLVPLLDTIEALASRNEMWSRDAKVKYLTETVVDPKVQPLRVPPLNHNAAASTPLFVEYSPGHARAAPWLLPAGYLFQVMDHPVTTDDARAADTRWRSEHPNAIPEPKPDSHRLECEAWALVHQRRGSYFSDRKMWHESEEAYEMSLQWVANNGAIWYCLGAIKEELGKYAEAAQAYEYAIRFAPFIQGPRMNLAILHARAGRYAEAERLLLDELKVNPQNRDAAANLDIVRKRSASKM